MLDIEAQIAHAERKAGNADAMIANIDADVAKQEDKLARQRKDLAGVRKAADAAAAEQRKASAHNMSLSAASLDEYRKLKGASALEAVGERQQLEGLAREDKTAGRALAADEAKLADFEASEERLKADVEKDKARKTELDDKIGTMVKDLDEAKGELDKLTSERTRIAYVHPRCRNLRA